jgi:hypothetical protein
MVNLNLKYWKTEVNGSTQLPTKKTSALEKTSLYLGYCAENSNLNM